MHMMKKIVIANTLKPVDDVRAFEKLAQSMAKTNKYEVNIIGNAGKKESEHRLIKFLPHTLRRSSYPNRLFLRYQTLAKIFQIAPQLIVITTHEYILISVIYKILCGCKVTYDIQEDYKKNLRYINGSNPLKKILSFTIRAKEILTRPFIDQYWLAEATYKEDLKFTKGKCLIVENKATDHKHPKFQTQLKPDNQVLFSGTVSHYSEVLLAIDSFLQLNKNRRDLFFKIIGQCHDPGLTHYLMEIAESKSEISLELSSDPVPHDRILEEIQASFLGIISYQENPVNRNKVPTKLYEYSRYHLPYLIQENTKWAIRAQTLGGAIPINFMDLNVNFILDQLKKPSNLFPKDYPENATWESEEVYLIKSTNALLK